MNRIDDKESNQKLLIAVLKNFNKNNIPFTGFKINIIQKYQTKNDYQLEHYYKQLLSKVNKTPFEAIGYLK